MYCYCAYTCTIITFLRYLFGLRAARLSIQVLSLTCDILVYYTCYSTLNIWMMCRQKETFDLLSLGLLGPVVEF